MPGMPRGVGMSLSLVRDEGDLAELSSPFPYASMGP